MSSQQLIRQGVLVDALDPVDLLLANSPVLGNAIDTQGYDNATLFLAIGVAGGTSPTLDVTVTESDTSGGTYTAISGAAFNTFSGTDDSSNQIAALDLKKRKRFLKVSCALTGTGATYLGYVGCFLSNFPRTKSDADHGTAPAGLAFNI